MNDCDSESTLFFCVRVARAVCILGDVTEVKRSLAPFFLCLALLPPSFFSQPYKNPKYESVIFFNFFLDNFRRPEKIKKNIGKDLLHKRKLCVSRPRGGAHSEEEEEEEDARRREHRKLLSSSSLRVFFLKEQKKRRNGIIIIFNREEWLCLFERIGIE